MGPIWWPAYAEAVKRECGAQCYSGGIWRGTKVTVSNFIPDCQLMAAVP